MNNVDYITPPQKTVLRIFNLIKWRVFQSKISVIKVVRKQRKKHLTLKAHPKLSIRKENFFPRLTKPMLAQSRPTLYFKRRLTTPPRKPLAIGTNLTTAITLALWSAAKVFIISPF